MRNNIAFLKESMNDLTQFIEVVYGFTQKKESPETMYRKITELYDNIDMEYLKSEVPQCLNQTQTGAKHIAKLVHSMKQFAHPGSKELVPVRLSNVIETVLDVTKNVWKNVADISVEINKEQDQVYSIQSELNQILMNLVINSCDSIVEQYGKNQKSGEIKIYTHLKNSFIDVFVVDNGTGIKDEILDKIFDPFFTTKEVGKGTGQGLAMIYHSINTKLKGKINVVNNESMGATFIISLPTEKEGQ